MLRLIAAIAAATVGGGLFLSRRVLDKEIKRRVSVEIEAARIEAEEEVDKRVGEIIRENLRAFAISLAIKASLVSVAYFAHLFGVIGPTAMTVIITLLVAAFFIRDVIITAPFIAPALRHAHRHGWRLRFALRELIAGVLFEQAYARALLETTKGKSRFFIALSTYSRESISAEVAEAVADVARKMSFKRMRARAATASSLALAMMAAYSGFIYLTTHPV